MFSQESINQQKLIEFLERLLKDIQRKVYIILDNLKVHHGKIVAEWVEEHKNHIRCSSFHPTRLSTTRMNT